MSGACVGIPRGWATTTLGNAFKWGSGGTPKSDEPRYYGGEIPWAIIGDLHDGVVSATAGKITPSGMANSSAKWIEPGSVLVAMYGSIGKLGIAGHRMTSNQAIAFANPKGVNGKYLFWYLASIRDALNRLGKGGTQQNISQTVLKAVTFPVAPFAEQNRIVAALEEHLSDLDAAVAGMERARRNAYRYIDAVRAAVVSGHTIGAPVAEDPDGLPLGWVWRTLAECAALEANAITDGPFGSKLKTEHYTEMGPRVVRLQNIGDAIFVNAIAHISDAHFATLQKHRIYAGDIVIAALGETLPRACLIPEYLGPAIVKADCIRFKSNEEVLLPAYASIALNAEPTRKRVTSMVHGVGRPRLNLGEVKSIVLPMPPIEEQRVIIVETEMRAAAATRAIGDIDFQLARAARLRQSILKRAFEGKLVPQDPSDEPAAVLLERIARERSVAAPARRAAAKRVPSTKR